MRTLLEDVLADHFDSQAELARLIRISPKHMCQLVAGSVPMSGEMALRLEHATGTMAELFLADDIPRVLERAREKRRSVTSHDSSDDGCDRSVQHR